MLDPPDTSRYIPASQPTKNDNLDPADQGGLNSRLSATTVTGDANGHFTVTLTTTSQYGGDNYIVEASADPAFPCATADPTGVDRCASTGTIQAWKRMYVEMDQMYRASALLSDFAFPGDTHIYINDSSLFKAGDSVTLIHAPSYNRSKVWDSAGFYSEANPVSVTKIAANRTTHPGKYDVSLSAPLTQNYYLDGVALGTTTPLGDALVNLSRYADPRKSGSPRFGSDERYVKTAFAEAYLDVLDTPTGGVGVPSYPALSEPAMYWVAEKWWRARTQATYPSNHGVAIAAATNGTEVNSLGTSNTFWSFVFRGTIDTLTAASKHNGTLVAGLDPVKVSGEVLVHELAHQWNVNPNYPKGECSQDSYDSTSSAHYFCQMDSPANTGQYADDHLEFHYVGTAPRTADSEYLIIRMQKEPKQ